MVNSPPRRLLVSSALVVTLTAHNQFDRYCNSSPNDPSDCLWHGVVFQVTFMASNLWFIVLCKDFDRTMRDPFSFYAGWSKRYHAFVWGICLAACLILGYPPGDPTYEEYKTTTPKGMYGEGHFGICWIRGIDGLNWYRWSLVFGPIIVSVLYSLIVLQRAYEFFAVGMVGSRKLRTTILFRCC